MTNLTALKSKIENELSPIYSDIKVVIDEKWQVLTEKNAQYNGERAYAGMQEAKITVYWDKFFDRMCGNGWMYGQDWLFKFDAKDGSCKYDGYPATVEEAVEKFIAKMKNNA